LAWPTVIPFNVRELAEGAGFEPAIRLLTVYTLSRRAP
jgi:hypothetical protein